MCSKQLKWIIIVNSDNWIYGIQTKIGFYYKILREQ